MLIIELEENYRGHLAQHPYSHSLAEISLRENKFFSTNKHVQILVDILIRMTLSFIQISLLKKF